MKTKQVTLSSTYDAPRLETYGKLVELTKGGSQISADSDGTLKNPTP